MKKFQFRLEPVLRVRRIQQDQARARLLDANREARATAELLETRRDQYASAARPAGLLGYEEFELMLFRLDSAAGSVRVAETFHRLALERVDERRTEWAAAKQRVAALDHLEERQRAEHAVGVRRAEDRLIDDLVVSRHRQRNTARGVRT